MTYSTTKKEFCENTVRIEAVDLGDNKVPSRYIPARIAERKCGTFLVLPVDSDHVEVVWLHGDRRLRSAQVIDRLMPRERGHSQYLRCPCCTKKRARLFFFAQQNTATTDFSFACAECALAVLNSNLHDRAQLHRRRRPR
jgi:hypothetical protein